MYGLGNSSSLEVEETYWDGSAKIEFKRKFNNYLLIT